MPPMASDALSRLARQFRPANFAERGAALPFANRHLPSCRIRLGKGGLEILVSGFAGGGEVYVLPAAQLGDIVALSLYDQALLANVMHAGALMPLQVRAQVQKVGLSGLGGREIQAQAESAYKEDQADRHATRRSILNCLAVSNGVLGVENGAPEVPAGQLLQAVADHLRIAPERCQAHIDRLAGVLYAVGCGNREPKGRLHRTLVRIRDFAEAIGTYEVDSEIRPLVDTTNRTLILATSILDEIDGLLESPVLLTAEPGAQTTLARAAQRFAWLVDGWDEICDTWRTATEGRRRTSFATLEQLMHTIPVLPRSELEPSPAPVGSPTIIKSRAVAPNQDWRTGAVDQAIALPQ
ncbi:MAG TPA: hypothetical protein VD978_16215 [Azospirillum sp.]|nr:hypothetical protein [Azospirillum sp.]